MLQWSQFKLASIQGVLFTPDASQFAPPSILGSILRHYAQRYDGPVEAIPLPGDIPMEVPRIILQSKDGRFKFHASPARIDSFWSVGRDADSDPVGLCVEVLEHYVRTIEMAPPLHVGRLALVLTRMADGEPNPTQVLINRFCHDEVKVQPFNHSEHFEVHNHKKYLLKSFGREVNSWVRCKSLTLNGPEGGKEVIVVEQDINTLAESVMENRFDGDSVRNFFACATAEADAILRIYFPER